MKTRKVSTKLLRVAGCHSGIGKAVYNEKGMRQDIMIDLSSLSIVEHKQFLAWEELNKVTS